MSNYITEAFKQLNLLEDVDEITEVGLDASGIEELRSFLDDAAVDPDEEMPMDIFDLEAEAKEDLKKSYEGKVILECSVCHSHIFEDKDNISMDEEGLACQDIECPYCMSNEGYYIIGEVAPFNQEEADKFEAEAEGEEEELDEVDIEGAADDIDDEDIIEESFNEDKIIERDGKKFGVLPNGKEIQIGGTKLVQDPKDPKKVERVEESYRRRKSRRSLKEAWNGVFSPKFILDNSCEIPNKEEAKKLSDWLYQEEYDSGFSSKDKCLEHYHWTFDNLYKEFKEKTSNVNEAMKLDGVKELYDNDEIRGVEEIEGVDELEGVKELHGDKHEDPINEACDKEAIKEGCDKELKEDIEDVSVTTEDETMTMTTKDDGGVVIETSPKEPELEDMPIEDSGEEMIVPVSDESSEVIDASIDALDDADEEEFDTLKDEIEEPEDEFDEFDEFDEESFDNLGESYLRNCYENVNSFKTSNVSSKGNKLFIEGVIGFDSGNKKKTNFVFEAIKNVDGSYKFEGYNEQISRGKKTFKLSGSIDNKKFVCESLNYNYRSKNELNESIRVYGTVKRK